MQGTLLTLLLLAGVPATDAPSAVVPTAAWHQQPAPPHCAHGTSRHAQWHAWKHALLHRQWLPRYTIHQGYNYVRPYDYRRAFDYPWHAPREPSPFTSEPVLSAPPALDLVPPPAVAPHETVYPDIDIPPQKSLP